MSGWRSVSLLGAVALSATLVVSVPGVAHSDPILPLPSPSLPSLDPSPEPDDDPLPDPGDLLPGGDDRDPTSPAVPDDSTGSDDDSGSSGKPGGFRDARPRPADPDDPGGDRYPHPPFAPIAGNPSAALLQRLYDAQARQRSLRNRIGTTRQELKRAEAAVADAKTELTSARRDRQSAVDGVQASVRDIYKSGAPYGVYTAVASPGVGVIRNSAADRLSSVESASEQVDYLTDQFAGAVDERDALAADLAKLKRKLDKANAIVERYQGRAAGIPSAGYQAGKLLWPVRGTVTSEYGNRYDPYYHSWQLHAGIDIAAPTGTPVRAAAPGRVVQAGEFGGYGNYICLAHRKVRDQRMTTCYGHLSRILVRKGQTVAAARKIGQVGSTGASTGPHLHFEVRLGGRPTDPRLWL